MSEFKNLSFTERGLLSKKIRKTYPNRIPVIIKLEENSNLKCTKFKFLAPNDIILSSFINELRTKHIKDLTAKQALFVTINNIMPPINSQFEELYDRYKNRDGFLYLNISVENTFGCINK